MIQQKIQKYHLDKALLDALLTSNFGSDGFEVEAHSEVYILTVPRELTALQNTVMNADTTSENVAGETDSIEDRLVALQTRNFESAYFVPTKDLEELLSKPSVQDILNRCGIEAEHRDETTSIILSGARRIFSILILMRDEALIRKFIEHDQFQFKHLDAKLPLTESALQQIIGNGPAKRFYRKQWMFVSPYFRNDLLHRILKHDVVLPFMDSSFIGRGDFGTVSEVTLHPRHQGITSAAGVAKLVKKTIEISNKSEDLSHRKEGDILYILRLVDHPNIVRLVATFSHRETYNMLFFPAECNLHELLNKDQRMPAFQTDSAFFIALQGLSSALATLHHFSSAEFDIQKIGCHHDLKPSNILVDKERFLLADFGLSKIKPADTDSKSLFNGADSYYLAPESEFSNVAFKRGLVGRMSDIWAFGCIIAELVTYILWGSDGVQNFQQGRKAKVMNWTLYLFHYQGQTSPFVQQWLQDLEQAAPPVFAGVFPLIQEMLEIDPTRRPNATSVCSTTSLLALRVQYQSVAEKMEHLLKSQGNDYALTVEYERLKLWESITRLLHADATWNTVTSALRNGVEFPEISQCLSSLTTFLNTLNISANDEFPFSLTMRQLRRHCDKFVRLLQAELADKLANLLEIQILHGANQSDLEMMENNNDESSLLPNLRLLAVAKLMSSARDTNTMVETVKRFDASNVYIQTEFGAQSDLAMLRPAAEPDSRIPVLVEWLPYNIRWTGEVGEELFTRVEALASTLRQKEKPSGFLNLYCSGFYHDVQRHSFGLVFELPVIVTSHHPITLKQMICDLQSVEKRPLLGEMFTFARTLSSSLLQFHKANWLHKSVSSLNVCFFPSDPDHMGESFNKPYLIGFNHSRQGDLNAFTSGPHDNPTQADYSHPDYLKDDKRFHPVYDYFSLGIVLLEMGLWKPLDSMSLSMAKEDEDQSPENLRAFLLRTYVPRLGHRMGEKFQKVVSKCLNSDFKSVGAELTSPDNSVLREFEEEVVMPLKSCYAL